MIHLLLVASALAAPPGYKVTKTGVQGCELSLGPAEADGVVPMRAECAWPDVTLERFEKAFGDWASHDEMFSSVAESAVLRTEGNRALVHQRHALSGVSDRELLLWMESSLVDGYKRYGWSKAADQPFEPAKGNVAAAKSIGYWQAKADPAGGVKVIHQLSYDPGGSVPGFLVRWFQVSGLEATVTEAHTALTK